MLTVADQPVVDQATSLDQRGQITDELWERLSGRVRSDLKFQKLFGDLDDMAQSGLANRIVNETIRMLRLMALQPGQHGPSEAVDIGWHMFVLDTRPYAEFCERVANRFIHHHPGSGSEDGVADVIAAFDTNGLGPADLELWIGAMLCGDAPPPCKPCDDPAD